MIALQLDTGSESLLALWSRGGAAQVALAGLRGRVLKQVYPVALPEWTIRTDGETPIVEVPAGPDARIFTVQR